MLGRTLEQLACVTPATWARCRLWGQVAQATHSPSVVPGCVARWPGSQPARQITQELVVLCLSVSPHCARAGTCEPIPLHGNSCTSCPVLVGGRGLIRLAGHPPSAVWHEAPMVDDPLRTLHARSRSAVVIFSDHFACRCLSHSDIPVRMSRAGGITGIILGWRLPLRAAHSANNEETSQCTVGRAVHR
jgi:hypothetical protein